MKLTLLQRFLFIALFLPSIPLLAQTGKGQSVIGLNTGIYAYKLDYNIGPDAYFRKTGSQYLDLNYGKFIKNDLLLGAAIGFANYRSADGNANGEYYVKNKGITFSPYIRQYFLSKNNFAFFAGAGYVLEFNNTKSNNTTAYNPEVRYLNSSLRAELGMNYFVSKDFAVEARLNAASDLTGLGSNNDAGITIGVKYWQGNTAFTPTEEVSDFKNWVVGIDVSTNSTTTVDISNKESIQSGFKGQIYVGKFFGTRKNQLVGLGFGTGITRNSNSTGTDNSRFSVITPFYEYYCKTNRLTPVAGLTSSFHLYGTESGVFFNETNLKLGLAYFLKDHFMIKMNFVNLGANFQRIESTSGSNSTVRQFDFSIFDNSTIGLAYRW